MNHQWAWYLTRATGIVATVLAIGALVLGLFFSSHNTGRRRRPAWWLDLHNWLGGMTLLFTAAHLVASYLDSSSGVGLPQLFVPGTMEGGAWPIAWGVIAAYVFALTVLTTWPKRFGNRRWWRIIHLTSVAGVALAGVHAYQSGSEAVDKAFQLGLAAGAAVGIYAVAVRVLALLIPRHDSQLLPRSAGGRSEPKDVD